MLSPDDIPSERQPAPFEPENLRRSIIALPLREAIEQEARLTSEFKEHYAGIITDQNAAIIYRADTKKSNAELRRIAEKHLKAGRRELKIRRTQRIDAVLEGLSPRVSLARLEGPVIRLLMQMDAATKEPVIERIWPSKFEVIIDINLDFKRGVNSKALQTEDALDARQIANNLIIAYIEEAKKKHGVVDADQEVHGRKTELSPQYVFARLEGPVIETLVKIDQREASRQAQAEAWLARKGKKGRSKKLTGAAGAAFDADVSERVRYFRTIHHVWPDFKLQGCITESISTVKVDAARLSFTASGKGITWAVADSGIDARHPHFGLHENIDAASPYHADFTEMTQPGSALQDEYGHGTHVAGIIAGEQSIAQKSDPAQMVAVWREEEELKSVSLKAVSGMAPQCALVSLKVLDRFGQGATSSVIAAIAHIQTINHHGRELHIHGLNLSLGYPFDPKWFACGYSPLCVEVNRLVKSGVVVVIAAGNTGYGTLLTKDGGQSDACLDLTINDPGNAEYAITVGSTHRSMPHRYGVSYFSSKGPTGDGRSKPDLLAPGEKIISCAAPKSRLVGDETENVKCAYFETSGTSMAAPHVSGAIAAFLSVRREYIGEPEKVKTIFTSTATDLGRDRYFQGAGLVDLMRAIQSV